MLQFRFTICLALPIDLAKPPQSIECVTGTDTLLLGNGN